jgi:cob(I)alamin adenosyltransferase
MPETRVDHEGLVQVYTGNGKGKTTAALGLALRATGNGMRVYVGQFLKDKPYGELYAVQRLSPLVTLEQYGTDGRVHVDGVTTEQRAAALEGLARVSEAMRSGEYDIVVADEINVALAYGVLTEEEVLELVDDRPPQVELVLTGRQASPAILGRADLVTEMQAVRHPYQKGVAARRGIEF